jgi:hypothetical protein
MARRGGYIDALEHLERAKGFVEIADLDDKVVLGHKASLICSGGD